MTACIGEPISWLRLESFVLGAPDPAIASHVAACPACRQCLDHIRDDAVALPPLVLPAAPLATPWWRRRWLVPALAAAAAAALVVLLLPRDEATSVAVGVKGVGEVTLELVRERGGAISYDSLRYAPGDRWKVVVTCAPSAPAVRVDVSVADGATTDHPLGSAELACGNRVVVPGAFTITGSAANRVCANLTAASGAESSTACLTVRPE